MAGLGAKDILRNITALEQLIEEINFQRAKEMRQCLMSKDTDTSFVIVHGNTYWTDLFVRHFLFQTDRSTDADDLLFFIRKKQVRGPKYIPKYTTEVEVYRKDSRKLPIGDPDIDWEETVYLNLIIHQFDYTLTLAVCTRTSPKELQVLRRHSQKVYASPSRRRMDIKGEVEEITYPNVCFHVDNFDEVFADMLVRDGEMVCVELVAADHGGSRQAVIFLGSIRYDALKRVYDTRASLSSKMAQRMMLGLFSGAASQRIEFVRMKGPQGKGHAEMAVTKPKGSGADAPTSEPGVSLTDLWDTDWDDEPEDRFLYRHQRRLSDPSANFNTFINSGWVSRAEGKSRSENEGLDNFANGLYEIESGDVRDDVCSCRCCSVACRRKLEEEDILLEVDGVCKKCEHFHGKQDFRECFPTSGSSAGSDSPTEFSAGDCNEAENVEESRKNGRETEVVLGVEASEMLECGDDEVEPYLQDESEVKFGDDSPVENEYFERSVSPSEHDLFLGHSASVVERNDPLQMLSGTCTSESKLKSQCSRMFSLKKKRRPPGSAVRVKSTPDLHQGHRQSSSKEYIPLSTTVNESQPCGSTQERIPNVSTPVDEWSRSLNQEVERRTRSYKGKLKSGQGTTKPSESRTTSEKSKSKEEPIEPSESRTTFEKSKSKQEPIEPYPSTSERVKAKSSQHASEKDFKHGKSKPCRISEESLSGQETFKACQNSSKTDPDALEMAQKVQISESNARTFKRSRLKLSSGPIYFRSFSLDPKKVEMGLKRSARIPRCLLVKSRSLDDMEVKKTLQRKVSIPFRVTKDGTFVYFPCDLSTFKVLVLPPSEALV